MDNIRAVIPYSPSPPPTSQREAGVVRAVWENFYRITQSLLDLDKPVSISGSSSESVTVSAATLWDRLFDEADAISWEQPPGQLDIAPNSGIWTAPQEGLYQLTVIIEVPAFASPASKLFTATLRTSATQNGVALPQALSKVGGDDRVPLRLVAIFLRPLSSGDTFYWDLDLTHETKTGAVTVLSVIQAHRISSLR